MDIKKFLLDRWSDYCSTPDKIYLSKATVENTGEPEGLKLKGTVLGTGRAVNETVWFIDQDSLFLNYQDCWSKQVYAVDKRNLEYLGGRDNGL